MSDIIFQKSLQDMVTGIRAHKLQCSAFISQEINNIKTELKSSDPFIKAEGIRKLTYLQMIGYNISWAAFSIIEVMSYPRFAHKQIGYLAANQSFNESTDLILLTTNLYKKEFSSASQYTSSQYEAGIALNSLSNIVTSELGRDCLSDIIGLINHQSAYLRKKAVLSLYKLYIRYPPALRLTFDLIKERLDDADSSVVSTAVSVICELANRNPRNYLALAPKFFHILTTSSNNWLLIKLVKLLGLLLAEEPRLARKLIDPLVAIITNNTAKSLQYECVSTLTIAFLNTKKEDGSDAKNVPGAVKVCSERLKEFISDADQNLKYLGLVGLVNLMRSHAKVVIDHRESVLLCLYDADVTIRTKALELLGGIVSKKSLEDIVKHLLTHLATSDGAYRDQLISTILHICSKEKYVNVSDFAWHLSTLIELSLLDGSTQSSTIAANIIDVCLRVKAVRAYAVHSLLPHLLDDDRILTHPLDTADQLTRACAWVIGEYSSYLSFISELKKSDDCDDEGHYLIDGPGGEESPTRFAGQDLHVSVFKSLLIPQIQLLAGDSQALCLHAAMKVFVRACKDCSETSIAQLLVITRCKLIPFLHSAHMEVMERASSFMQLLISLQVVTATDWQGQDDSLQASDISGAKRAKEVTHILSALVNEQFYVVSSKAQRKVPSPDGIDLSKRIENTSVDEFLLTTGSDSKIGTHAPSPHNLTLLPNSLALQRQNQFAENINSQNTQSEFKQSQIQDSTVKAAATVSYNAGATYSNKDKAESLFYLRSNSNIAEVLPLSKVLLETFEDNNHKGKKSKKAKKAKKSGIDVIEMQPAGAISSDEEAPSSSRKYRSKSRKGQGDEEVCLDSIDITTPLRPDEVIPIQSHRSIPTISNSGKKRSSRKEKRSTDVTSNLSGPPRSAKDESFLEHQESKTELSRRDGKEKRMSSSKKDKHSRHIEGDLLGLEFPVTLRQTTL